MASKITIIGCFLLFSQAVSWEALPNIPTGRRSQFLVLNQNGGYKYGYDTGDGHAAKQSGDANNQVEGHYFYKNSAGQDVDLKYTAGVQGFVPENLEKLQALTRNEIDLGRSYQPRFQGYSYNVPSSSQYNSQGDQANTGDSSYSFGFDTDSYKRQENSDAQGNVQGSYSYVNNDGQHDLTYIAGSKTGFVATSGTLAKANGLTGASGYGYAKYAPSIQNSGYSGQNFGYSGQNAGYSGLNSGYSGRNLDGAFGNVNQDGSYSYSYNTGDHSHVQSGDAGGNVQGRYAYTNEAGNHDLSYISGSGTGFQVTGGSLATPNGLRGSTFYRTPTAQTYSSSHSYGSPQSSTYSSTGASPDGSYSFSYNAGDSSRQESADTSGNVQGKYSYRNNAGNHDLSYVAGSATGFQVTGGSLAQPTGAVGDSVARGSFTAPTTYLPPPGQSSDEEGSTDDQSNTGDSSYAFTIDTDDYKRVESSDVQGNVQGSFSYKNEAGTHDLSYVAGSNSGFVATGGSLSDPNAIAAKISALPQSSPSIAPRTYIPPSASLVANGDESDDDGATTDNQANTGDASYSFSINTNDYQRHEASDASGNIQGGYSYKNAVGNHDLNFVAGTATGFLPTSGSLKTPPGLTDEQLRSGFKAVAKAYLPPLQSDLIAGLPIPSQIISRAFPSTQLAYNLDGASIKTYLPPSNDQGKFGYIYDTK